MKSIQAALFDLDGVLFDTEGQYSHFWGEVGKHYHPEIENFANQIKGRTLRQIFELYFPDVKAQKQITKELNAFESSMSFDYIAGAPDFIRELRAHGIKTAVVTSSNEVKMKNVYRTWESFASMFDTIITADKISHSKPDPECYELAAKTLEKNREECVVFEDSFSGLEAGRRADMGVVALATTNPVESVLNKADIVIRDFEQFSYKSFVSCFEQ